MTSRFKICSINFKSLMEKWETLQSKPNVFAYNLNIEKRKYLPGNCHFYAEYNPERSSLRRPPQTISSLDPQFNVATFNFNKVDQAEYLDCIHFENTEVAFIINKSPLTQFHILIIPDIGAQHAQRLTLFSLRVAVAILMQATDKAFRIGYNSPGALASVNHLHLHLMYLEVDLYIDRLKLTPLNDSLDVFRTDEASSTVPKTPVICFLFKECETDNQIERKLKKIYDFINWLCENNRPHNFFLTKERSNGTETGNSNNLKFFIYARENYCFVKDPQSCNIGFCELSGFVPVGNLDVYNNLNEEFVISKICYEVGDVYKDVYNYFNEQH